MTLQARVGHTARKLTALLAGGRVLPELIDVGQKDLLLPPGIHQGDLGDVRARFVDTEPQYRRRVELWALYETFRTLVRGFVPVQQEFLDGSFVTSRPAPKDTDVSFWINASDIEALSSDQAAAFSTLWAQRMSVYGCDAYLVPQCGPQHIGHGEFQFMKATTERYWSAYKNRSKEVVDGVTKGYVEVLS